jgi:hypothetical protein
VVDFQAAAGVASPRYSNCLSLALSIVIVLMALTALPAAAETFAGVGIDYSCERWAADRRQDGVTARQDEQWVLGYLSAVADWSDLDPLHGIDRQGVWAWMDNYCQANPLVKITEAASAFVRDHPGK